MQASMTSSPAPSAPEHREGQPLATAEGPLLLGDPHSWAQQT